MHIHYLNKPQVHWRDVSKLSTTDTFCFPRADTLPWIPFQFLLIGEIINGKTSAARQVLKMQELSLIA